MLDAGTVYSVIVVCLVGMFILVDFIIRMRRRKKQNESFLGEWALMYNLPRNGDSDSKYRRRLMAHISTPSHLKDPDIIPAGHEVTKNE